MSHDLSKRALGFSPWSSNRLHGQGPGGLGHLKVEPAKLVAFASGSVKSHHYLSVGRWSQSTLQAAQIQEAWKGSVLAVQDESSQQARKPVKV